MTVELAAYGFVPIGSNGHFALIAVALLLGLGIVLHRWVSSPHYRHVSHRKLRAASAYAIARKQPATGPNAPCNAPVASPHHRTADHPAAQDDIPTAVYRGSAVTTSSVEPHPAAERSVESALGCGASNDRANFPSAARPKPATETHGSHSVAGPHPRIGGASATSALPGAAGPGQQQPVDVMPPDVASTGDQPPWLDVVEGRRCGGVVGPETTTPTTRVA